MMDDANVFRSANGQQMFGSAPAPAPAAAPAPGAPRADANGASVGVPGSPGFVSTGPGGSIAGPGSSGAAVQPPAGVRPPAPAIAPPPGPPGSLAQGPGPAAQVPAPPSSSSGAPNSLAQGFPAVPKWDPATVATEAPQFAKDVAAWARGHQAQAALAARGWGDHFTVPPSAPGPAQPGAAFSPQVNSMLARLRAQGWNHAQVPGVGHVIRHPSGKAFVFHPENGSLTPFNQATLAQGAR